MSFMGDDGEGTWGTATGWGTGNRRADPLLVAGWPDVDLHLQAGSPPMVAATEERLEGLELTLMVPESQGPRGASIMVSAIWIE